MAINTENSEIAFNDAKQYIPGGVDSPVRAYKNVGRTPLFISKAKGDRIWDIDGNEFIDYVGSWGPNIIGAANDRVVSAVSAAAQKGLTYGAPTIAETILAREICEAYPAAERVRLVNSGTEATMSAIRTARGATGRDKIIKFRGNYHGHSDALLASAGSGVLTDSLPDSAGVPANATKDTLLADYNDPASVEALFEANKDEIAAVIVEPVAANMGVVPPKEGFLEALRSITKKYRALLIFDEVITGFRLSYGGAAQAFGIQPDMVCFGKIVGGGMPLAAYGGKKWIMSKVAPDGPVYQAGTLSGNPVAVAAGIETLAILKSHPSIYERLDQKAATIEKAFRDKGLNVNRAGSLLSVFMTDEPVTDEKSARTSDTERFTKYFNQMLENGIYVAPSQFEAMFVSAVHTKEDIAKTCDVIKNLEL